MKNLIYVILCGMLFFACKKETPVEIKTLILHNVTDDSLRLKFKSGAGSIFKHNVHFRNLDEIEIGPNEQVEIRGDITDTLFLNGDFHSGNGHPARDEFIFPSMDTVVAFNRTNEKHGQIVRLTLNPKEYVGFRIQVQYQTIYDSAILVYKNGVEVKRIPICFNQIVGTINGQPLMGCSLSNFFGTIGYLPTKWLEGTRGVITYTTSSHLPLIQKELWSEGATHANTHFPDRPAYYFMHSF
ncbi:MAG TPA: hypothetical protein VGB63_11945 [Pedobacter sp.]|jgi:hypothetical protein